MLKSNYKKLLAAMVSASVAATSVAAVVPFNVLHVEASGFEDVHSGSYYYDAVSDLTEKGVINGFEDGTFRPDHEATRGQVATMIARALGLDGKGAQAPGFADVNQSDYFHDSIAALVEAGIVNGVSDDSFQPNRPITRAEMAKIIASAFNYGEGQSAATAFTDIPEDSWYTGFVGALFDNEITTGRTPTTFAPNENVKRAEIATFIYRAQQKAVAELSVIEKVTDDIVTINGQPYAVGEEVQGLFNVDNASILMNALVEFEVNNGEITKVTSLEITESGTPAASGASERVSHLVFDAQGATIEGNVTVNGDYVTVKNLTVTGDFKVGAMVQNSFYSNNLVVEGTTFVEEEMMTKAATDTKKVKIIFANSTLKVVVINKNDVDFESQGSTTLLEVKVSANTTITADKSVVIPKITLQIGANEVEINADVEELTIDSTEEMTLSGDASFENVSIEKKISVNLYTTGKIKNLEVKSSEAKITIKKGTKVGNLVVPEGAKADDVIDNYDDVKKDIEKINGEPNKDARSKTSAGGGGGSSSGGDSSDDNDDDDDNDNQPDPGKDDGDQTAPTPTVVGGAGKITGAVADTVYLVSIDGETWVEKIADASGEIALAAGTYSIKVKATETALESAAQTGVVVTEVTTP